MTYSQFQEAFIEHFKQRPEVGGNIEQLSPRLKGNLEFALSTNERGKKFLDTLSSRRKINWSKATVLDVGCAYGGAAIEAAKLGAKAYGIDINPDFIRLAEINAAETDLKTEFHCLSVTDRRLPKTLPRGQFTVMIVNDVFEHVYDTTGLLDNLSQLADPGCILYFAIPNGFDLDYIQCEGHTKGFGCSIVNPFYWYVSPTKGLNIFYRRWEYYVALFEKFGFGTLKLLNYPSPERDVNRENMVEKFSLLEQENLQRLQSGEHPAFYKAVQNEIETLHHEFHDDIQHLNTQRLAWKYQTKFWTGLAQFTGIPK